MSDEDVGMGGVLGTTSAVNNRKNAAADDQEGEEGVAQVEAAEETGQHAPPNKAKRIISYDAATRIWVNELGNPKSRFMWDPKDPEYFTCGVCEDKPYIRCKTMTLKQHCGRDKHKLALASYNRTGGGQGGQGGKVEQEEPEVVVEKKKQRKKPEKKKVEKKRARPPPPPPSPSPEPDEEEEEEEEESEPKVVIKKTPKKNGRAKPSPAKKKAKTKPKIVEDEEEEEDDAEAQVDLEEAWQNYKAKHLGPKQQEAMFKKRLQRIVDQFEK